MSFPQTERRTFEGLVSELDQALRRELDSLRPRLTGRIIFPQDKDYDLSRRVYNGRFDPHPAAIIYCESEDDLRQCLRAIKSAGVPFRLRSGGHSVAGHSACDGIMIDLTGLNDLAADPIGLVADVGSGCPQGKLEQLLGVHGLQLPLGDAPDVTVAGFMQGGGWGIVSRTFGMNCDNVVQARVMLADGRIVQASETINHDLWWAIRGGTGGNFGVLLSIRYALHRAPEVNYWSLSWPLSRDSERGNAVTVLLELQKLARDGSAQMNAAALAVFTAEKEGNVPQAPWLVLWGAFVGTKSDMIAALRALLLVPGCVHGFTQAPIASRTTAFYRESRYVSSPLDAANWRAILECFLASPNPFSVLQIHTMGGAINAYPCEKSAFIHRTAAFNIFLDTFWRNEVEKCAAQSFLTGWCNLMKPFWNGHIYQNFPSASVPDYRWNYWGNAFSALLGVKQKYDPDGLFDFPQMVAPRDGKRESAEWPPEVVGFLLRPIEFAESCG